ncbi:beta-phosphoglucomutase [Fontibacillus phaseoli]|uniref:Beta-phosphoglucomutase n=1 Tax=Fontibacillus phaseoli TaxID=1416533 RepID=A0A369BEG2_9BACL|nr:beta-phosphoglucomutase [Fontibacillus phaseoli]RCX19615.1 beta-phosphoglucomutase [Fontibacillus phaseoli]
MNKEHQEIQAIIFDLDGVITDTAKYHYEAWKQLADELNIPFDWKFNEQLKGIDRMASLEKILSQLPDEGKSFTLEQKQDWATSKNMNYQLLIEKVDESEILPGILDLFHDLKQAGIPAGLASASRNARTLVRQLKVEPFFDVIVDPTSVAQGKPAPDIFLKAAEELGVASRYCVGVEDAEAGIQAIKSAGMFAVGVGDADTLSDADYIVAETSQLSFYDIRRHFVG